MQDYWAHTRDNDDTLQRLSDHLQNTAELASRFAAEFNASELGRIIGLLHDIGKYSKEFQNRILNNGPKVDHSTAGAQVCMNKRSMTAAMCIAGHHGELRNLGNPKNNAEQGTLFARINKKNIPDYSAYTTEITIPEIFPTYPYPVTDKKHQYLLIRMLYSALVDADYLDTERFMMGNERKAFTNTNFNEMLECLNTHIYPLMKNPTNTLNTYRCKVLADCIEAGKTFPRGIYSLTVPTGGGKTKSTLAFALNHAVQQQTAGNSIKRIICVIPYVSIIEQTVETFSDIVGKENVLAHYSSMDFEDTTTSDTADSEDGLGNSRTLAIENWDAPLIVTTAVQFFESLYANKPARSRKIHNIANSIIIFDEAQMIPVPYLKPCTTMIDLLVSHFGCTALLCTATQPALNKYFSQPVTEICSIVDTLFEHLKRVTFINIGKQSDDELVEQLAKLDQVLCIVNTRKQAQELYTKLPKEGTFHLSTLMVPAHRKATLDTIKARLTDHLPCRVISTSLVEAGVDLDFPVVFRALSGLDSILQAAGRCNREGIHPREESFVYIFEAKDDYHEPIIWQQNKTLAARIIDKYEDFSSPQAVKDYYQQLFNLKGDEALDTKRILELVNQYNYQTVGENFKLIDDNTYTIYVPFPDSDAPKLFQQLRNKEYSKQLFRDLSKYSINIYIPAYQKLKAAGVLDELWEGVAILNSETNYDINIGFKLETVQGTGFFD